MSEMLGFPPDLLTKAHVAYLLSTSEWGVSQLVRQKKLTQYDDGGKWAKFKLTEVREYIDTIKAKS